MQRKGSLNHTLCGVDAIEQDLLAARDKVSRCSEATSLATHKSANVSDDEEAEDSMLIAVRTRRDARCAVLRILYALDSLGRLDQQAVDQTVAVVIAPVGDGDDNSLSDSESFARNLLAGTLKSVLELDRLVQQSSEHWTLPRICRIDRNILRLGVFELLNFQDTPISVIINEAVELAKRYAAPDAAAFVNGVLDHAARAIRGAEQERRKVV